MSAISNLKTYLFKEVSIAPLVIFRLAFGALLFYSTVRTIQKGWVKELYIDPGYHFSFFDWIKPLDGSGMIIVFYLMALLAMLIILGLFYRLSLGFFLLLFTYSELIDKTYYLNHYYLVSLLTFWLMLVPANRWYSLDAVLFPKIKSDRCAQWHILIFKIQLSIVYFFAGLAKVNPDWLFKAQPMATWLPGKYTIPILGKWVHLKSVAFLFSWAGCIYDISIWVFLLMRKTRTIAYLLVLVFHILTGILFPRIGMFPYIMITSTIIFFSSSWHEKVLSYLPFSGYFSRREKQETFNPRYKSIVTWALIAYVIVQLYLPVRFLNYPGNLFWHEQGYRFSWRVMLMEKNGYTSIIVKDPVMNTLKEVDQELFLTPFQEQQMRSQPDMILQFARYVGDRFREEKGYNPEIYVKSRLSLNGRRSQPFTDETLDIYNIADPMAQGWILPFGEKQDN
ncbi:MAG: HTTM domain-containing protein [Bacteroidota bacterium]